MSEVFDVFDEIAKVHGQGAVVALDEWLQKHGKTLVKPGYCYPIKPYVVFEPGVTHKHVLSNCCDWYEDDTHPLGGVWKGTWEVIE